MEASQSTSLGSSTLQASPQGMLTGARQACLPLGRLLGRLAKHAQHGIVVGRQGLLCGRLELEPQHVPAGRARGLNSRLQRHTQSCLCQRAGPVLSSSCCPAWHAAWTAPVLDPGSRQLGLVQGGSRHQRCREGQPAGLQATAPAATDYATPRVACSPAPPLHQPMRPWLSTPGLTNSLHAASCTPRGRHLQSRCLWGHGCRDGMNAQSGSCPG